MRFKDISIKRKITYLYLPFVIIPVVIFFLISTKLYEDSIIKRSQQNMEDNSLLVADSINRILNQAESSATYLTISINTLLNNPTYQGEIVNDVKLYSLISNELSYAKLIYDNVDSIAFFDVERRVYYTDNRLFYNWFKVDDTDYFKTLEDSSGNLIWKDLEKRDFISTSSDEAILTLGKKVWNINTGKTLGYLFINISEDTIGQVFNNQVADYYLLKDREVTTSSSSGVLTMNTFLESFLENSALSAIDESFGINKLYTKTTIDRLDYTLVSTIALEDLTRDFENLLVVLSVMLLVIIVMDIIISSVLNAMITKPIVELKGGLEEIASGNLNHKFDVTSNDEIGVFAESFNHMSDQIKVLLHQVEMEEEQKRAFELALIQQQIKPHFLYNTLDIILKLSQMGQDRKAQKVTKRLADYYKNSLSGGNDVVALKNEIKITKDYLELQKIRYSDILDYNINLSSSLDDIRIPKLTLQPLVENAIYHGLKYKSEKGLIEITDEISEDGYYILVKDNGVGIEELKLKMILSYLSSNDFNYNREVTESFGMRNVNHRLKLFFGDGYGLDIISSVNEGTTIRIKLPKEVKHD